MNGEELICTILQKWHGHDAHEWRDYDQDNVPFERLEKVYDPNEVLPYKGYIGAAPKGMGFQPFWS